MSKPILEKLSAMMRDVMYCNTVMTLYERNTTLLSTLYGSPSEEYAEALIRLTEVTEDKLTPEAFNSFLLENIEDIDTSSNAFAKKLLEPSMLAIMEQRRKELNIAFKSIELEPGFEYVRESDPTPELLMRILQDKGLDGKEIFTIVVHIRTISKSIFLEYMAASEYDSVAAFIEFACITVLTRWEHLQKAIADTNTILRNTTMDDGELFNHLFMNNDESIIQ